jgi:amino acid adenylation domain-containing protein
MSEVTPDLLESSDLSQSQYLIWIGQKLSSGKPLYNMSFRFNLKGHIDIQAFQRAFQLLVDQSDAMRSIVIEADGVPKLSFLPHYTYHTEVIDWQKEHKENNFDKWIQDRCERIFPLDKPMFDSVLIKKSDDHYAWFLNQHHLITDGWSCTILFKKLSEFYSQISQGCEVDQDIPTPHFRKYLDYERSKRLQPSPEQSKAHWEKMLKTASPKPELYGYKNVVMGSSSERLTLALGKERSKQLKVLASEPGIRAWSQHMSLFSIFMTTLFVLVRRISNQKHLTIGTPAHNRVTKEFKETPGVFIELYPLKVDFSEKETFNSLFQKVQLEANNFLKYAHPGAASTELSRSFNIVLNYINASFSSFSDIPVASEWIHPGHADPAHLLRLQVHDFDATGIIKLHFDLNSDTFPESVIKDVPQHFLQILDGFIEDRAQLITKPELIQESQIVLDNNTEYENENDSESILSLIDKQASCGKGSIVCGEEELSLTEVNNRANQLARYLRNLGIGEANDRVAIWMKRTPDLLVAILGVLKSGAAYVPIDSFQSIKRVTEMTEDAGVKMMITSNEISQNTDATFEVPVFKIDTEWNQINQLEDANVEIEILSKQIAYVMYTSGSTGKPKGVMVSHGNLSFYLNWAKNHYKITEDSVIPLFSAIGFDLTVTSIFLPLITGATMICYEESDSSPDLSVITVVEDNKSSFIKLTPSHLELLSEVDLSSSRINTMVLGGENLKFDLARNIVNRIGSGLNLYNEYGPTEATVGCIVHEMTSEDKTQVNVPIGKPLKGTYATLLDSFDHQVPQGVEGELFISGPNLAQGYWNDTELSDSKFISLADLGQRKFYRTGDLARMNELGCFEFLGRKDEQVKVGGIRLELGEIESAINKHPEVNNCVVDLKSKIVKLKNEHVINCSKCGLPSNYPNITFDDEDICSLCQSYSTYGHRVTKYFKSPEYLRSLLNNRSKTEESEYDCMALLSGGKDSTYALGKLVDMGLRVLAFTLDNGYISDQAKGNIKRVVEGLGVDHVYGSTPHMNDIFVDSLEKHYNVCDGCFKTIYTLSTNVALEKKIPFIVTGLSRGQFFETRLTEELFTDDNLDISKIDSVILDARKAYHKVDDAVNRLLDVTSFEDDKVFERVKFLDFYRYTDVSLDEMLEYLDQKLPWKRPTDTGRSTNCLINQAGIFVHKKERGYSNYAFPYSWDVRLGHKKRDASLDEINEEIDEQQVHQMLQEIGYEGAMKSDEDNHLIAYYMSDTKIDDSVLRAHLEGIIPSHMIPKQFIPISNFPLNNNGKVDKKTLPLPDLIKSSERVEYVAPRTDIEEILVDIWSEVLNIEKVGIHDRFLELGGGSLAAIRIISRANEAFELELPVNLAFNKPTIASFAIFVRDTILRLLEEEDD